MLFCFLQDHTQFIGTQAVGYDGAFPLRGDRFSCGLVFVGLLPGLFLVLWFVGFLFRYHPVVDSGLRNGPRSTFDSPMWDAYSCIV